MKELQEDCKMDKSVQEDVSLGEVLKLLIKYIICKMNMQKILFLLAFLSFGAADGISAAYMIEERGVVGEANPLIRFMYASRGRNGVTTSIAGWSTTNGALRGENSFAKQVPDRSSWCLKKRR